jgi:hypothetical protein
MASNFILKFEPGVNSCVSETASRYRPKQPVIMFFNSSVFIFFQCSSFIFWISWYAFINSGTLDAGFLKSKFFSISEISKPTAAPFSTLFQLKSIPSKILLMSLDLCLLETLGIRYLHL